MGFLGNIKALLSPPANTGDTYIPDWYVQQQLREQDEKNRPRDLLRKQSTKWLMEELGFRWDWAQQAYLGQVNRHNVLASLGTKVVKITERRLMSERSLKTTAARVILSNASPNEKRQRLVNWLASQAAKREAEHTRSKPTPIKRKCK